MESKAAKRYFSRVQRCLVCPAASRYQLLGRGRRLVTQFEQENPNAQYSDFVSAFGSPENFAGEMLSTVDKKEVEAAQRRRRLGYRLALTCLVLVLCVTAVLGWAKWSKVQEVIQGDRWIAKGVPEEITQEEYEAVHKKIQAQTNTLIP